MYIYAMLCIFIHYKLKKHKPALIYANQNIIYNIYLHI